MKTLQSNQFIGLSEKELLNIQGGALFTLPEKVPDEFKEFLPNEIVTFYNGLTEEVNDILETIS